MAADHETNNCTKEHFERFLHPEEFDDMRDVVLKETIDDLDKDKDGFINITEYLCEL